MFETLAKAGLILDLAITQDEIRFSFPDETIRFWLRDRFGGKGSRAIIVTSTTVSEEDSPMRRRADELNIEVIEWNELPLEQLVNRLRMRPVG